MGGRLWVESELGRGSRFYFCMPVRLGDAQSDWMVPKLTASLARRFLYVQSHPGTDYPDLRQITTQQCARLEIDMVYTWLDKTSGQFCLFDTGAAVDLSKLVFDAVLVDSIDLAACIREFPYTRHTPIMVIVRDLERLNVKECISMGIASYVNDPGNFASFGTALHVALENNMAAPSNLSMQRSQKILLVEDNLVNQRLAVKMLEKFGHKVTVADNGKEAVEMFEQQPFDIILMDIQVRETCSLEHFCFSIRSDTLIGRCQ